MRSANARLRLTIGCVGRGLALACALLGIAGPACAGPSDAAALDAALPSAPAVSARGPQHPALLGDAELLASAERFLDERTWRRAALEASLTSRTNLYARRRLQNYALEQGGWDALPPWNPRVHYLRHDEGAAAPIAESAFRIFSGERPTTLAQWRTLGEATFFAYPLRPEPQLAHAVSHPELAREHGLEPAADGRWLGVIGFEGIDGQPQIGITCALCHADQADGVTVVGRARRSLNYGALRLAYAEAIARPLPRERAKAMQAWGPGRADVSDDEDTDPVAIVDLWGLREHQYFTQAGTLKHVDLATLAMRQETQILYANGARARPPRELAVALAIYLYSLEAPLPDACDVERESESESESESEPEPGAALFAKHCAGCHALTNGSGPLVSAAEVGTDPAMALGGARGTGSYRPAPLIDLLHAAPYMHDGSIDSLSQLLDPARLRPDYTGGRLGPGAVLGHPFGTQLPASQRRRLERHLRAGACPPDL